MLEIKVKSRPSLDGKSPLINVVASLVVLFGSVTGAYCQIMMSWSNSREQNPNSVNMSSPTASAFTQYVVNPVGYYTGVPSISILIYDVRLKDFSLPISLNYHSGGIKVDETASNVGLGWSLSAGGMITRAVKDKPDDDHIDDCRAIQFLYQGVSYPPMQPSYTCGNGLLWALTTPSSTYYDGLTSYNIDLNSFGGITGSANAAMKLIRKFYGVGQFSGGTDIYLLSMADKEPDIYYYNFAGRTGQFMFDMSTGVPEVRTTPYQDLKIVHFTDTYHRLSGFTITDERGVVYTFNSVETTQNSTGVNTAPLDDDYIDGGGLTHHVKSYETGNGSKTYNSSWFLTRIDTPLGDYLDFTYEDEEYPLSHRGPQQTGLSHVRIPTGSMAYNPNVIDALGRGYYNSLRRNEQEINTKRISKIENPQILIDFNERSIKRKDLVSGTLSVVTYSGASAIEEIIVTNKIGGPTRVKKVAFSYDYFLSEDTEEINPEVTGYEGDNYKIDVAKPETYYKRLRLRSVQEFGQDDNNFLPPYKFEYKYYDFTGNFAHILPHRLSFQQDIWGYYNGAAGNKTLIPSMYVYPNQYPVKDARQFSVYKKNTFTAPEYFLPAANRLPDVNLMDVGVLTKIIYPTKGTATYIFEPHDFRHEGQDYTGGGLRIKRIIKSDEENIDKNIITNYWYKNSDETTSSGAIISMPNFAQYTTPNIWGLTPGSELAYKSYTTRYSIPQSAMLQTNSSYVGYRTVKEYISQYSTPTALFGNLMGIKTFTYSMPATWHVKNDIPISTTNGECDPLIDGHCDGFYALTTIKDLVVTSSSPNLNTAIYDFTYNPALPNTFPYPDNPNYDWQRGHLLSEKHYDDQIRLVREINYRYKNYFPAGKTAPASIHGFKFSHHYARLASSASFAQSYLFRIAKYTILADVTKVLDRKTETTYEPGNLSKSMVVETEQFNTSTSHSQVTKIETKDSQNNTLTTVLQYPNDLTGAELGGDVLRAKKINGVVLRETTTKGSTALSKTEQAYATKNSKAVLSTLTRYKEGTQNVEKISFDYDNNGNLTNTFPIVQETSTLKEEGMNIAYIWGYSNRLPIAQIQNAKPANVFYSGFEVTEGNSSANDCKTGIRSKTGGYTKSLTGLANGAYTLFYWEKSGAVWILRQSPVNVTTGAYTINIPTVQVDDVRFYPKDSRMISYTYNNQNQVSSIMDENGNVIYYTYDLLGRLSVIKDVDSNIVKKYEYQYKVN